MATQILSNTVTFNTVEDLLASTDDFQAATVTDGLRGGDFIRDNGNSPEKQWTANLQDGGDILITTQGGFIFTRDLSQGIRPEWFGAKPAYKNASGVWFNDDFDNSTAFNNAMAAIKAAFGTGYGSKPSQLFLSPGRSYAFGSTVNLDTNISIEGNGCTFFPVEGFNTTLSTLKYLCISYGRTESIMMEGQYNNINFLGAPPRFFEQTTNRGIVAIIHDGPANTQKPLFDNARVKINGCTFNGFYRAEIYNNKAYLIKHTQCHYRFNNLHILSNIASDAGENISYVECSFDNGGELQINNGFFNFYACSIDYTRASVTINNNATVSLFGCHIENLPANFNGPFVTLSAQAKFYASGTHFYGGPGAGTASIECMFYGNGWMTDIYLEKCFFSITVGYKQLYKGTGDFSTPGCMHLTQSQVKDIVSLTSRNNFALQLQSLTANDPRALIGIFKFRAYSDDAYAYRYVADNKFDSGKCLAITKLKAGGIGEYMALVFPIKNGREPHLSFKCYSNNNISFPNFGLGYTSELSAPPAAGTNYGWVIGNENITWNTGAVTITPDLKEPLGMFGTSSDFINSTQEPRTRIKTGLTHCYIYFVLDNMQPNDELRIGDINLFIM